MRHSQRYEALVWAFARPTDRIAGGTVPHNETIEEGQWLILPQTGEALG